MSHQQKKARIIERAITFTGLKQSAAGELASKASDLSIRQLRRVIGAIQGDFHRGLRILDDLVPKTEKQKKANRRESRQAKTIAA